MEKKIFTSYSTHKGLMYRIYENLKKLTSRRTNDLINKWENELNRQFSEEEIQMANKYMNILTLKEMQPKSTLRFHLNPVRLVIHQENKQQMLARI
jgi:hypothetical protein